MVTIYNRMIMNRILPQLDSHLRKNQNDCCKDKNRNPNIHRLLQNFDTIHRGILLMILKSYGIAEELVMAISIM